MLEIKSPVLLIGFNRPEYFKLRLKEILSWNPPHLYITIDGPRTDEDKIELDIIYREISNIPDSQQFTVWVLEKNLGLSFHITEAVSKVLTKETNLIIIEDDIEMYYNCYLSLSSVLNNELINNFSIVSGFSSIPSPPKVINFLFPNLFRAGIYTGLWGWGVRRDKWQLYKLEIMSDEFRENLDNSKLWRNLSSRQKNIWLNRFSKVSKNPKLTWDYQMQYLVFKYDLPVLSPIFRSCDNVGFNSPLSTNTKGKRPRYYFGNTDYRKISRINSSKILSKVMNFFDAFSDLIPFLKSTISSVLFWQKIRDPEPQSK